MAYTTQQLVDIYTRANAGAAPSAATRLTLDAYAQQTQPGGGLSEQAALNQTLSLVNNTTAVAVATYQFFNGAAPSAAGLTYLLNSSTNANDLNDTTGVYGSFNQDSRFINFSINLALAGTNAAAFATSYGSPVTFRETVASAYDKIIGNAVATAAGNNVTDAVNWFSRQANIDALTGFVRANNPTFTAAQIDLAVKAAVIGQILSTAVSTGLGIYAGATRAAITDLSDDGVITGNTDAGLNIIAAYPGAGGGVVGKTFALTGDIDTLVGTGNDDTFTGSVGGATNTVNALDSIDGGAGVDTLILSDAAGTATLNTAALAVKNVEVVNLTSATGLLNGTLNTTGWTGLTAANVTVGAPAADQAITAGAGTAVSLTAGNVGGNDLSVDGGSAVTVKTTAQGAGTISVGSVTAPAGVVSVSTVGAYADGANTALGTITVKGGTSVSVAQASGITAAQVEAAKADTTNFTVAQAAVNVTGTSTTTSVSVTQSAAVTEVDSTGTDGVIGVTTGAVTITDVNAGDATKAGTITTVTLANGSQTVASNALTTLNVSGTNTTAATLVAGASTSKALTVNLAGGTTNLTEGNGNLTSITVNATANGTFGLSAAGVVTANLGGSKALTFNPTSVAALKTVNISGAGGVTSVLSTTGVTKIDASTSTGANSITLNGATTKIAYIGGTGSDTVRIAGTLDANASIQLGAGNDRLLAGAAGVIGASTTAVVDGGDGVDAISSALISAVNASVFKNFEVLNLQSTGADIVDVSLLTGSTITGLELNGGTGSASYTNLTTAQSLAVTGNSTGGTATLLFNGVAGTADSYAISFNANVTGTASSPTTVNAQTVSVAGIENLSIASGSAAGVASNVIALTDAAARTLTITGSQALTVNFTGAFGTTGANGVNIDASAATGSIKLGATGGLVALGTVDGGSQIKTGAGADVITVGALANTQQVILTTGGGKDVIDVSATVGTFGSGATAAALVTVTDFSATDSLVFAAGNGTEVFTSTKVDLTGVNDFAAALTAATTASGAVNSQITWFNYGGNTYIVENNDGAGFNTATDIVVKMTGTLDLSTAVFNATTNTFSLV